jgi:hypothetical protein
MGTYYVDYEGYTGRETCADTLMFRISLTVCTMFNKSKDYCLCIIILGLNWIIA